MAAEKVVECLMAEEEKAGAEDTEKEGEAVADTEILEEWEAVAME